MFLSSKSREVVRATLEFIKVTIGVLPAAELIPHVQDMVDRASVNITANCTDLSII